MKIKQISIQNVRGIRNSIDICFDEKNSVVFGPNGTGKSAVVDAIDFLFTGDMSRLGGIGTKELSVKKHGKHIDAKIGDAFVKATISINGIKDPIQIQRKLSKPKELICPDDLDETFEEALKIAEKGQYVLSRSEIIKFIAAEAGKRSEEVQAILNLSKIESTRRTFVSINSEAEQKKKLSESSLESSKTQINTKIGIKTFSEDQVLTEVNRLRKILKGTEITELKDKRIKEGISPRSSSKTDGIDYKQLKNAVDAVETFVTKEKSNIIDDERKLREELLNIKNDQKLKRDLHSKKLLDLGISLIDESGKCPLCLTEWKPGELNRLLEGRQSSAVMATATENRNKCNTLLDKVNLKISTIKTNLDIIIENLNKHKKKEIVIGLPDWSNDLETWLNQLKNPIEDYPTQKISDEIKRLYAIENWEKRRDLIYEIISKDEKSTPEQSAWDTLTTLETLLERYFEDKEKHAKSVDFAELTLYLLTEYTNTKDRALEKLFESVNDDFCKYYRAIHGDDEEDFHSELKPKGSLLGLQVDFYGRGKHHPRALHSEGHQDSMGLCLYLALNKKISEGKVKFVILDDVVMSIDSGHRRSVCKLFNKFFPDIQFVITTHNRTWARQLRTDGVVISKNMTEFRNWSVESGPNLEQSLEIWDKIKVDINENKISSAAHQLREYLEYFFENVCDSINAPICYRTDSRYELGDYLDGAKSAYKSLLRNAKKSAASWDKTDEVDKLNKIESQVNEVIIRTQMEQWAVNENVHYNKWGDSYNHDFLPVVEAFQDFVGFYNCPECNSIINLVKKGTEKIAYKCPCGKINKNLEIRENN